MNADTLLRRVGLRKGHTDPVPDSTGRLVRLTDTYPLFFLGGRDWCDAVRRPCPACGGRCCACTHTERKPA